MKTLRRAVSLLLIALTISLALCETGLRLAIASVPAAAATLSPLQHRLDFMFDKRYLNRDMQDATRDLAVPGYTITNDERLTTDQPSRYSRTVWLFGSSTVLGAYVDDNATIASYLQREFNRRALPWRVVNVGQPGINITIETYWLTTRHIKPRDMIMFVDGAVDLNNIVADSHKAWQSATFSCQAASHIPLITLSLWCNETTAGRPPQAFISPLISSYWRGVDKARQYAIAHGATFTHFMQPAMPHDGDLYAEMGHGDMLLAINRADYYDELHYDNAGHAQIAAQIAAQFGAF